MQSPLPLRANSSYCFVFAVPATVWHDSLAARVIESFPTATHATSQPYLSPAVFIENSSAARRAAQLVRNSIMRRLCRPHHRTASLHDVDSEHPPPARPPSTHEPTALLRPTLQAVCVPRSTSHIAPLFLIFEQWRLCYIAATLSRIRLRSRDPNRHPLQSLASHTRISLP